MVADFFRFASSRLAFFELILLWLTIVATCIFLIASARSWIVADPLLMLDNVRRGIERFDLAAQSQLVTRA